MTEKYGKEKVAHIITYGTMATKTAIKDVARVQKLPLERIGPSVQAGARQDSRQASEPGQRHRLRARTEGGRAVGRSPGARYDQICQDAEGNVRGTGVHACGTIICRDDITDWVPVSTADDKETGEKMLVTQYEGSVIEDTGLIKMDFLGLKTLSIIKDAVPMYIRRRRAGSTSTTYRFHDPATYKLYCDGHTIGTFQFESPGMQKYLRELQPSTFEDLIAMNALYRPGPMDYIPDFIAASTDASPSCTTSPSWRSI